MPTELIRKKIRWATKRRNGGSRVWKSKIITVKRHSTPVKTVPKKPS